MHVLLQTETHSLNCSCYNRIFISLLLSCYFHLFYTCIHYFSSKITALEIERKFAMHKRGKQFSHITHYIIQSVLFLCVLRQIFMMQGKQNYCINIHVEYLLILATFLSTFKEKTNTRIEQLYPVQNYIITFLLYLHERFAFLLHRKQHFSHTCSALGDSDYIYFCLYKRKFVQMQ